MINGSSRHDGYLERPHQAHSSPGLSEGLADKLEMLICYLNQVHHQHVDSDNGRSPKLLPFIQIEGYHNF